ncbi:MAG: heavy metal-binding domain-containing protein [Chitinivibrionales bacterium]|nr:heavy metal-binding domain-containing protein [Chitinivibrionales bacterium]
MRFLKLSFKVVPVACTVAAIMTASIVGQTTKSGQADTVKKVAAAKQLKPQTTCPIQGEIINKKLFVDYKGKRIYVCCPSCMDSVKANPEKYIAKLKALGQDVETIGAAKKKSDKSAPADTSMKNMNMTADSASKVSEAGYWTCPMHPQIHQATAGQCPICGMNLVYQKSDKSAAQPMGKGK